MGQVGLPPHLFLFRMLHLLVLRQVRFTLFADFVGDAAGGLDFGDVDRARRAPSSTATSATGGSQYGSRRQARWWRPRFPLRPASRRSVPIAGRTVISPPAVLLPNSEPSAAAVRALVGVEIIEALNGDGVLRGDTVGVGEREILIGTPRMWRRGRE